MPRNGSGTYSLPAGNPVVSGEVITPTWANPTMDDIGAELTDSLSRSGKGGMLVPFLNIDGVVGTPGMSWINEPSTGFFREASNDMRAGVAGVPSTRWIAGDLGFEVWDGTGFVKPLYAQSDPVTIAGAWTFTGLTTHNGGVRIANAVRLTALDTVAGIHNLASISATDVVEFGANSAALTSTNLIGPSGKFIQMLVGSEENVQVVPRASGSLLVKDVSNNYGIVARISGDAQTISSQYIFSASFNHAGCIANNGAAYGGRELGGSSKPLLFISTGDRVQMGNAALPTDALGAWTFAVAAAFATNSKVLNVSNSAYLAFNAIGNAGFAWRIGNGGSADNNFLIFNDGTGGSIMNIGAIDNVTTWGFTHQFNGPTHFSGLVNFNNLTRLANNISLDGLNTGAGAVELILVNASDQLQIGTNQLAHQYRSLGDQTFRVGAGNDESGKFTTRAAGSLTVMTRTGDPRKAGFRNPDSFFINGAVTATQDNEGQIIYNNDVSGGQITLPALETDTCIRVMNRGSGNITLLQSGTTIQWLDGATGSVTNGNRTVGPGGVAEIYYFGTTVATVFGSGIS